MYKILPETSLKNISDIDRISGLKKLYQVNLNELIVFACIRLSGKLKDSSEHGIDLFNSNPTEKLVFINPNENLKLEKIILPLNLQTKEIPFDVKEVTHLYLYNIGLKSIPDNINEYSNSKYLDISLNYIEDSEIEKNEKIQQIRKDL